jgi:very-short-patch-repair endonuclease
MIETSDYSIGLWSPEVGHLWWSDVATSIKMGKPLFLGRKTGWHEHDPIEGGFAISNLGVDFGDCSLPDLKVLAGAFWTHGGRDPGHPNSGRWLVQQLQRLESPIEARLFVHLVGQITTSTVCDIEPQKQIGKYRADFAISSAGNEEMETGLGETPMAHVRLIVEADGHDFHERTKEQAQRDKQRDRELQRLGWKVIRFTGSEIWKDAAGCAREVMGQIETLGGAF